MFGKPTHHLEKMLVNKLVDVASKRFRFSAVSVEDSRVQAFLHKLPLMTRYNIRKYLDTKNCSAFLRISFFLVECGFGGDWNRQH